ncbi:unnamed protein product [Diamesa hyperborea]
MYKHYAFLLAELNDVERMISETPKDQLIDRLSMENRAEVVKERIIKQKEKCFLIENSDVFFDKNIDPYVELGAYEMLWETKDIWYKEVSNMLSKKLPSNLFHQYDTLERVDKVLLRIKNSSIKKFGIQIRGTPEYPHKLLDASIPVELLYYAGDWNLASSKSVAIIGSRKATSNGVRRAQKIATAMVENGYAVFSGLAEGD